MFNIFKPKEKQLSGVFPVKAGDVIQVNGNMERSCFFIPGIWV